jgi:DNA-directed RNA polymerase delta subunit
LASLWFGMNVASRYKIACEFDRMSIQNWGVSNHTLNALLSYDFKMTVGDVIRAGEGLTITGLSKTGIEELNRKVSQLLAETHDLNIQLSLDQPTIATISDAPGDLPIKALPQSLQSVPLDQLHLDEKTHAALVKAGIVTIGELYNCSNIRLCEIQGFHLDSLGIVNSSLISLLNSINHAGDFDWFQYWKGQEIQILPPASTSITSQEQIIRELPKIVEEILRREKDERSWSIIQRRFGLGKTEELTLEDLGNAYNLSRERIRQLEEKALRILGNVLIEQHYAGKNYHVHPLVPQMAETIRDIIFKEPSRLLLEIKLIDRLHQRLHIDAERAKSSLLLLLSLIGGERTFLYPNAMPIWGYIERGQRKVFESGIKRLDDFLTRETILPLSKIDILAQLNKRVKKPEGVTPAQLMWLIDLCSTIEGREDGSVWGKFECLKGRGNQVERILVESGSPMRIADIVRTINHRLVSSEQRRITARNLVNQIASDDRFVSIGKSGQWGLKSWPNLDTKSILALMEDCLIARNKPASIDEIFTYVGERRLVKKHSITRYLNEKETFVKIGRTTWGLANWSDVAETDTWNRQQVAEFVASIFKNNKVKELSYKMLKEALMQEAGITAKQAQGLLNTNPVIKTRRVSPWGGERIAILQPNFRAVLVDEKKYSSRQRVSLRQQVQESAYSILDTAPNKQMPMAELIHQLHKQFERPENTLYAYVQAMNSVQRIDVPNSRTKICRVSGAMKNVDIGNLRDKVSKRVRAILEATPNEQMPLNDLIQYLLKECRCPEKTLYRYIADLDFVERLYLPDSRAKICRLKGIKGKEAFPQAHHIATDGLKQSVLRAITMLNETEVDLGLFSLSRDFENTLKAYLIAADANGKFQIPTKEPSDKWRLANMIDWARKDGIITDSAALNYLRHERNNRAHGGMPPLTERQNMMKSIQYPAGLYIGYIKLLDDLTQNL